MGARLIVLDVDVFVTIRELHTLVKAKAIAQDGPSNAGMFWGHVLVTDRAVPLAYREMHFRHHQKDGAGDGKAKMFGKKGRGREGYGAAPDVWDTGMRPLPEDQCVDVFVDLLMDMPRPGSAESTIVDRHHHHGHHPRRGGAELSTGLGVMGHLFFQEEPMRFTPEPMMRMFQPENGRNGFDQLDVPAAIRTGAVPMPDPATLSAVIDRECQLRLDPGTLSAFKDPGIDDSRVIESVQLAAGAAFGLGPEVLDLIRCAQVLAPACPAVRRAHYVKFNRTTQGTLRQGDPVPAMGLVDACSGQAVPLASYMRPGRPLVVAAGSYT